MAYPPGEFIDIFLVGNELAYSCLVLPAEYCHRKCQHGAECYAGADGCPDNAVQRYQYIARYRQGEKSDAGTDRAVTYFSASDKIMAEYAVAP